MALKMLVMHIRPSHFDLRKDYEEVGIETAEGGLHIYWIHVYVYIYLYLYIYISMYIIHMSHTYLHKLDFLLQDSILFGFLIVLHIIFVPRALFIIRWRRRRRLWRRILSLWQHPATSCDAVRNVGGSRKHGTILHVRLFHAAVLFSLRQKMRWKEGNWDLDGCADMFMTASCFGTFMWSWSLRSSRTSFKQTLLFTLIECSFHSYCAFVCSWYVFVCVYIYMYTYIYICTYLHSWRCDTTTLHIYIYTRVYIYIYTTLIYSTFSV